MTTQQRRFVKALAEFLSGDLANKSLKLAMGDPLAHAWSAVRTETPVRGYGSVAEAEQDLAQFLFGEDL